MFQHVRQKPWERPFGAHSPSVRWRLEWLPIEWLPQPSSPRHLNPLSVAEDGYLGPPVTDKTALIPAAGRDIDAMVETIKSMAREHRFALVNYGLTPKGEMAVTFRSKKQAALFRLFWLDDADADG